MLRFTRPIILMLGPCLAIAQTVTTSNVREATPLLRCFVSYADQTTIVKTRLQQSPYEIQTTDIGGRFAFKATMIGDKNKINYIALYTYFQASPKDLPIHEAIYRGPFNPTRTAQALGPENHLYAGEVERELKYHCELKLETE